MEPEVFAEAGFAVAESGRGLLGGRSDAVLREGDGAVENSRERLGHRAQGEPGIDRAAGPAAVRQQNDPCAGAR